MATYTAVAVARTPAEATGPTLVELGELRGSISYSDALNEAPDIVVHVSVDTLAADMKARFRDPLGLPLEVWVYRDSTLVAAGPVVGGEIKDGVLSISARGLEYHTAYMLITANKFWTAEDHSTIAAEVVDDWQALAYGDYGIDTSAIVATGNVRTQAVPGETEPLSVYEFLLANAGADNGYDWFVDPATREMHVVAARGDNLFDSVFLELGVTSSAVRFAVSPGMVVSDVFATGTGPTITAPLTTTKFDAPTRAVFGRAGYATTADPVEDATHLDDLTQAFLDERTSVFFVPGPSLIPVTGAGVNDFGVGDFVTYTFDAGLGQQTGTYRIVRRTVEVSDSGQESMTVEFA